MTATDDRRRAARAAYYRARRRSAILELATRPEGGETVTVDELCRRLRLDGVRLRPAEARVWLAYWMRDGIVEEPVAGRFRLTEKGRRLAPW